MPGFALRLVGTLVALLITTAETFAMGNQDRVELPIKQPEEIIRAEILKYTPLGSSPEAVLTFINSRLAHEHSHAEPYYDTKNGVQVPQPKGWPTVIGERSISLLVGTYGRSLRTIFTVYTGVYAYWAFDERDSLIDVIVIKEQDGP